MMVEGSVSILLAVTIGYCVVLNERLKRLHADRDVMGAMVADLVQATDLANRAVGELKASAIEAELALQSRLEEAEHFGIQLANHVAAGQEVMQRIAKVAAAVQAARQQEPEAPPQPVVTRLQSALQRLAERERIRSDAA
jgi:hypothetical protein